MQLPYSTFRTYVFKECDFIAVTAYQNEKVIIYVAMFLREIIVFGKGYVAFALVFFWLQPYASPLLLQLNCPLPLHLSESFFSLCSPSVATFGRER